MDKNGSSKSRLIYGQAFLLIRIEDAVPSEWDIFHAIFIPQQNSNSVFTELMSSNMLV